MKLAQSQPPFAQFIDLSADPKKPDAIELKIEALRRQKEIEKMRQTSMEFINKEKKFIQTQDAKAWNLLISKKQANKYTYDYDCTPLKISNPKIIPIQAPQAKVLSQNIVINAVVSEPSKTQPKFMPNVVENIYPRAATSVTKKAGSMELIEKKTFKPQVAQSANNLEPFEPLEKQVLRDVKLSKGVSLKIGGVNHIKESEILEPIAENPEIKERMSRDQYLKLRAEQENTIYNTLKNNYARMSRSGNRNTYSSQNNFNSNLRSKSPMEEIEIEKNNEPNLYGFDLPVIQANKEQILREDQKENFNRRNQGLPNEIGFALVKEKPEKSRTETETSITFCNDQRLLNYFFENEKQSKPTNQLNQYISPRENESKTPLIGTNNRARDLLSEGQSQLVWNKQTGNSQYGHQPPALLSNEIDHKRPFSVVKFTDQFQETMTPDKNKIKLPKSLSSGIRPRDRFKIQAPRLKKMYDYFA